jgi:hypothetical protein
VRNKIKKKKKKKKEKKKNKKKKKKSHSFKTCVLYIYVQFIGPFFIAAIFFRQTCYGGHRGKGELQLHTLTTPPRHRNTKNTGEW